MADEIQDPRDFSTTPAGQTVAPAADYDPRDNSAPARAPASPLKTAYQGGKPVVADVPWATNPNDDAYGGRPGSWDRFTDEPFVAGLGRGARDTIDTGA